MSANCAASIPAVNQSRAGSDGRTGHGELMKGARERHSMDQAKGEDERDARTAELRLTRLSTRDIDDRQHDQRLDNGTVTATAGRRQVNASAIECARREGADLPQEGRQSPVEQDDAQHEQNLPEAVRQEAREAEAEIPARGASTRAGAATRSSCAAGLTSPPSSHIVSSALPSDETIVNA